jgi:hypothetical protein
MTSTRPAAGLTLLLSAPVDPRPYDASLLPAGSYRPAQILFGCDAQLVALAAFARQAGQASAFVPAPEIFSPSSSAPLLAGLGPGARLHLRFGPARHARLLKGIATLAVLAEEAPLSPPLLLGRHPFAGGDTLPAGCAGTLHYDPTAPAWRRHGGGALPSALLPAACAVADLPPGGPADHGAAWPTGLFLQSLADLTLDDWPDDWPAVPPPRPMPRRPVMLPWNLAHDASCLTALLELLARHAAWRGERLTPVLFPFNAAYGRSDTLSQALVRLRAAAAETALPPERIFLARMTDAGGTARLAGWFPLAWIDLSDPEQAFVRRRLAHLGIACAGIGGRPAAAPDSAFAIPAAATRPRALDDWFGPRQCEVALPTLPALTELVRRTLSFTPAAAPCPAPCPAPAALVAGAFFATLLGIAERRA